jgi:hypothetical protein
MLADALGRPLRLILTGGQVHDIVTPSTATGKPLQRHRTWFEPGNAGHGGIFQHHAAFVQQAEMEISFPDASSTPVGSRLIWQVVVSFLSLLRLLIVGHWHDLALPVETALALNCLP